MPDPDTKIEEEIRRFDDRIKRELRKAYDRIERELKAGKKKKKK